MEEPFTEQSYPGLIPMLDCIDIQRDKLLERVAILEKEIADLKVGLAELRGMLPSDPQTELPRNLSVMVPG